MPPARGPIRLSLLARKWTSGQVLCIIEAMKLMNEIESDVAGEIVKIFAENGQPVNTASPCSAFASAAKSRLAELRSVRVKCSEKF